MTFLMANTTTTNQKKIVMVILSAIVKLIIFFSPHMPKLNFTPEGQTCPLAIC